MSRLCREAQDWISRGIYDGLPISALIRSPSLAITYKSEAREVKLIHCTYFVTFCLQIMLQTRMFQVRLMHVADFDKIVITLKQWQCHTKEGQTRASSSKNTTKSANTPQVVSGSLGDRGPSRPVSAAAAFMSHQETRANPSDDYDSFDISQALDFGPSIQPHVNRPGYDSAVTSSTTNPQKHLSNASPEGSYGLGTPLSMSDMFPSSSAPQIGFGMGTHPDRDRPIPTPLKYFQATESQSLPPRRELPFGDQQSSPTKPPRLPRPMSVTGSSNASPTKKAAIKRPSSAVTHSNNKKKRLDPQSMLAENTGSLAQVTQQLEGSSVLSTLDPNALIDTRHEASNEQPASDDTVGTSAKRLFVPNISESEQMATLRAYSAAPTRDRQAVIDTMIADYIGDDNFLTLCQDVENAWRRIGLEINSD